MGKTHYFDYTPPGVLLNDQLLGRGLSPEDLAEMCGYSIDKINGVIRGDEHVDETVARQFELSLGIDADLWLNIESNYISHLRRGLEVQYRELAKRGYVPVLSKKELTQRIPNLMAFFGVDCDDALVAWRRRMKVTADAVAYRHSPKFDSDAVAVAAWLRMGSFDAPDEVPEFSEERFKSALNTIRALTSREPSMWDKTIEEAAQLCHESGVVLSVVKPLKDVALDGAFRWLDDRKKKGIIQLSARWKRTTASGSVCSTRLDIYCCRWKMPESMDWMPRCGSLNPMLRIRTPMIPMRGRSQSKKRCKSMRGLRIF